MFIFSLGILFSTYYLNQIFHDPFLTSSVTYDSLKTLQGSFAFNQQVNAGLIFGDFIAALKLIGGLMTGSVFSSSLQIIQNSGFADLSIGLFMGILFDSATLFLLIYIVSNRSI